MKFNIIKFAVVVVMPIIVVGCGRTPSIQDKSEMKDNGVSHTIQFDGFLALSVGQTDGWLYSIFAPHPHCNLHPENTISAQCSVYKNEPPPNQVSAGNITVRNNGKLLRVINPENSVKKGQYLYPGRTIPSMFAIGQTVSIEGSGDEFPPFKITTSAINPINETFDIPNENLDSKKEYVLKINEAKINRLYYLDIRPALKANDLINFNKSVRCNYRSSDKIVIGNEHFSALKNKPEKIVVMFGVMNAKTVKVGKHTVQVIAYYGLGTKNYLVKW